MINLPQNDVQMAHRIWQRRRPLPAIFGRLIVLILALASAGCRSPIVGVTTDSPSNNLAALLTSIISYEVSYDRCPESLMVLGPPRPGETVSSQAAGLIAPDLASGKHAGYVYRYHRSTKSKGCQFTISADPIDAGGGQLHYFTDESAVRRFEIDREATATSPRYEKDN
jgi:hypothetical protein